MQWDVFYRKVSKCGKQTHCVGLWCVHLFYSKCMFQHPPGARGQTQPVTVRQSLWGIRGNLSTGMWCKEKPASLINGLNINHQH